MKPQYIEKNKDGTYYYADKKMTILHREDGAAVEYACGTKQWWVDGNLHREDGPAIEWASGRITWYLNGERLTEAEFLRRTTKLELTLDEIAAKFGVDPKNLKIKK